MLPLTRRNFASRFAAGGAALVIPKVVFATTRRAVDLAPGRAPVIWSLDHGTTWGNELPQLGQSVLFRVPVTNLGSAAAPINRPIHVGAYLDDELIAVADHHRSGLAPGETAWLTMNTGPMRDPLWHDVQPGNYKLEFRIDVPDYHPGELSEENNTTAVLAQDFPVLDGEGRLSGFGMAVQVAASVIGGVLSGGLSIAATSLAAAAAGWAERNYTGPIGPSTPIGASRSAGGGGAFPTSIERAGSLFGTTWERLAFIMRTPGWGIVPSYNWGTGDNTKVYGSGGLYYKAGSRAALYGYLHAYRGRGIGGQDDRQIALAADGFLNRDRAPILEGGVATAAGCGTAQFYGGVCGRHALGASITPADNRYPSVELLAKRGGFRDFNSIWIPDRVINHLSANGLPRSLRPSPINGTNEFGRNGLRTAWHECWRLNSEVWNIGFDQWLNTGIKQCFVYRAMFPMGLPVFLFILRHIIRQFLENGWNPTAIAQAVRQAAIAAGRSDVTFDAILEVLAHFTSGNFMTDSEMFGIAMQCIERMRTGLRGPNRVAVDPAVQNLVRPGHPRQVQNYQTVVTIYDHWKDGLIHRIDVTPDGLIDAS